LEDTVQKPDKKRPYLEQLNSSFTRDPVSGLSALVVFYSGQYFYALNLVNPSLGGKWPEMKHLRAIDRDRVGVLDAFYPLNCDAVAKYLISGMLVCPKCRPRTKKQRSK
jgi:hypothetical protein